MSNLEQLWHTEPIPKITKSSQCYIAVTAKGKVKLIQSEYDKRLLDPHDSFVKWCDFRDILIIN